MKGRPRFRCGRNAKVLTPVKVQCSPSSPCSPPKRGLRVGPGGSALPLICVARPGVLDRSGRGTPRLSPCAPSGRRGRTRNIPWLLTNLALEFPRPGEQAGQIRPVNGTLLIDTTNFPLRAVCRDVVHDVCQGHVLAPLRQQPGYAQAPAPPASVAGKRELGDMLGGLAEGDKVRTAGTDWVAHGASQPWHP